MNDKLKKIFPLIIAVVVAVSIVAVHAAKKQYNTNSPTETTLITVKTTNDTLTAKNQTESPKVVKRLDVNSKDVIALFSEVTFASSQAVVKAINERQKTSKEIFLLIDSPGGSVFDGAQVITAIEASKVPVNTVCVGMCASMGAMIHAYGAKRLMFDRAVLMFHPAAGGVQGSLDQMESRLKLIRSYTHKMDKYIANRSGMDVNKFESMFNDELWIDAEDSVNLKLADGIVFVPFEYMPSDQQVQNNRLRYYTTDFKN